MSKLIGIDTPARLLREQWASPIDLAQELYAMFTAKGPTEIRDTLTIRVPEGKPALRIERVSEADTFNTTHSNNLSKVSSAPVQTPQVRRPTAPRDVAPARGSSVISATETTANRGQERFTPSASSASRSFSEVPLVEIAGGVSFTGKSPVQFSTPPIIVNPHTGIREDLADAVSRKIKPQVEENNGPFFGRIVSGVGSEYVVKIFPLGFASAAQGDQIVQIPNILDTEVIDAGTEIFPIYKINSTYYYQPPVWMP